MELQQRALLTRRLTIAIATPIGLLVVLGVMLGYQVRQMAEDSEWVDHTDQVISTGHKTLLQIIDQETSVRGYLLTDERSFLEPFERAVPDEGFAALHQLVSDNPSQQVKFEEAHKRYREWLSAVSPALEVPHAPAPRRPPGMEDNTGRRNRVRSAMQAAIEVEEGLRTARLATSHASIERTQGAFLVLISAAAVLLAFLSRRQLSAIALTFGAALEAEVKARRETESEGWIRAGHARLVDALQGDKQLAQLGRECLAVLGATTGADIGAFFTREAGRWRRRAGFAMDEGEGEAESFGEGEGVVGRVAAEGKVHHLREVPPGFLKIRSGTGGSSPVDVVLVPAAVDGAVSAVVELGFLHPVEGRSLELLGRVGDSVGVAVRSAEHKQQLRDLLEEAQRQTEELQTQQEELRVANEELEVQTTTLRKVQSQLENQQAELEQTNEQLVEQSQLLERHNQHLADKQAEIAAKALEVERASQFKSEFLSNMSHELRTPLNSSLILAKLLSDNKDGNLSEEQVKFAATIYSAGNDLLALINDILDLSKIEAGKIDIRPGRVPLERVVATLRRTFEPIANDKRLTLRVSLDPSAPAAMESDVQRLEQILKNLVSNALKFTDQGEVAVTISMQDERLSFAVRDTGIGIPKGQQGIIFEAFRQADGTTNRKYGGTGLGLSISRELARLLGGDIGVDSEAGRGSTFTLHLPRLYAPPTSELLPSLGPSSFGRTTTTPTLIPGTHGAAPLAASAPGVWSPPSPGASAGGAVASAAGVGETAGERAPSFRTPTLTDGKEGLKPGQRLLLVIEDDEAFAQVLRDVAQEASFPCVVASSAEQGVFLAKKHVPTGIVLDMNLPDHKGLTVLDRLKRDPATRHIPVHIISASDYAEEALSMGAVSYWIKPVKREQLIEAMRTIEARSSHRLRRVLVVEDDDVLRQSVAKLLGRSDVEISTAGTVQDALALLRQTTFDCIVTDLALPDQSGYELLETMALQEPYSVPPVIVYTGRALTADEEQKLRKYSRSIIVKGARSPERLLDEVTLFLHQVESELPPDQQRLLVQTRNREALFEGKTILVVEDDVRNVFALTSVLEPKGARVAIARNGKEALTALEKEPRVDIVLMDLMMPEMDGLEATREIRKNPRWATLPIIALTAKAMRDDQEWCRAAGANDYLAKPLDVEMLLSLLRVWMPRS